MLVVETMRKPPCFAVDTRRFSFTLHCTRMRVMSTTRRLIRIMIIVSIMLSTPMCVETFYFSFFKTNFVFEKAGGNSTSSSLSVNLSLFGP